MCSRCFSALLSLSFVCVLMSPCRGQGPCFNIESVPCSQLVDFTDYSCGEKYCSLKEWFKNGQSQGLKWFCNSSDLTTGDEVASASVDVAAHIPGGNGSQSMDSGTIQICKVRKKCSCAMLDPDSTPTSLACGIDSGAPVEDVDSFINTLNGGPLLFNCTTTFGGGGPGGSNP